MDFFMPAERVLYDRSYFFSDERRWRSIPQR